MPRYAKNRDASQPEIVKALRDAGCEVEIINGVFDLLVYVQSDHYWYGPTGRECGLGFGLYLIECKTDIGKTKRVLKTTKPQTKTRQQAFAERFPVVVLGSAAEALAWLRGER